MGLLDALDESIATVEAEHQDKGSPTTATLASTAAAPPASCGTYERTSSPDTYRCAANGFYLYKRSENSWCVGKEPGGASCKCYQSKKGWQFYVSKKWTLRADVSLTWDDATGSSTDPSVPAAEEATAAEKPQTARVQGGMLADDDDATSSSGDDDEEVEVAAAPAAPPAKTSTAEPAKKKTSDAFGLAYTPYEVYDAAPARDAESSDDESDAESATAAPANSPPVASQATGDAPDLPSDKVRSLDSAPPPKNANNGKPRAGAKAPPPAHVAQDRPPPAEAKAPPASAPAPSAAASAPPTADGNFKAFDPAVLARTVAAYRAPVAAAPDSNEDAWANLEKPPDQKEVEEPIKAEPITYDEALRYFQGLDMSSDKEKITPTQPDQRHVLKRIFKRRPDLKAPDAERDFVFLVALQKYDPLNSVHWRMIHTVFRELTPKNKPVPCPTLGAHWVRIGFQGNDPRTDVNRAMRCLALLQLLHLLEKERRLAGALFRAANQGGM